MAECEMCGKSGAEYVVLVEGAKLAVCQNCSTMGQIIKKPDYHPEGKKGESMPSQVFRGAKTELELIEEFGKKIRGAREANGMQLSVLADAINEKESYLKRIENENTRPDEKTAKKLEHELGIKLFEEVGSGNSPVQISGRKEGGMSLWDLAQKKKR